MVKRNNSNARKQRKPKPSRKSKRSAPATRMLGQLDAYGSAYARMLLDPCNAQLVPAAYAGMGTGEYRRYRRIISFPTGVEGTVAFSFATNSYLLGSHVAGNAGTPYTMNINQLFAAAELQLNNESRCLAGCVKVRFIGAESNRAGLVGFNVAPTEFGFPGLTITNSESLARCTITNRLGEVQHEAKFAPGTGDEEFSKGYTATYDGTARNTGTITVVLSSVPTGSIQFEITAIMEIEAAKDSGLVTSSIPPRTGNTLNHVLRALGPSASWAYGTVVAPTIRAMAGAAMQTVTNGLSTASASRMLLTL